MSFYVSTATFFLLHCVEGDHVVALPRHKFVTGATLLQLSTEYRDVSYVQYRDVQVPRCLDTEVSGVKTRITVELCDAKYIVH